MNDNEIRRHTVGIGASVRDALEALNALSGEVMTLFAVDDAGRLAGTVTDGDIRRALISGTGLDDSVADVMHRGFRSLRSGDDMYLKVTGAREAGISLLPVLEDGKVVGIIDLRRVRTALPLDAVLMAGGRGERLRPLTNDTPKPLLPVGGKPIIDYNIDELAACGIANIFVTVNYLAEMIIDHFDRRAAGPRVECVREPRRLGTMGSLALVEGLTHDNLIVMNSDLLTTLDFEKMYLHHVRSGAMLTVAAVPYTVSVPFAILDTQEDKIMGLSEKPTFNYFANGGVYMLRRSLLERIEPGQFLDAPDFIESLISDGLKVSYFPIDGTWIDIGSPDDYRYANQLMSRRAGDK